jgi:hypothetical protein
LGHWAFFVYGDFYFAVFVARRRDYLHSAFVCLFP